MSGKMRGACLAVAVAVSSLASVATARATQGDFNYEDYGLVPEHWDLPLSIVISPGEGQAILGSDVVQLKVCPADSEFICFESYMITFAVPRGGAKVGDRWTYGKFNFRVLNEFKYGHLGQSMHVIRIRAQAKGSVVRDYLYSSDRGLVAIDEYDQGSDVSHHYILREECGFGGASDK